MPTEVLKNNIQTTLLAAIDSNDAVITPTDPTNFPATGEQARGAIGSEIVIVEGGDGPQFTVERGAEGTTAVGHAAGDAIRLVLTAGAMDTLSPLRKRVIHLSEAQMATIASGNPVDVVGGVPGVIHVPISGTLVPIPGAVPYSGSQEQFVEYDTRDSVLSFGVMSFGGVTPGVALTPTATNLVPAVIVGSALQLAPDGAMSSLGAIVSASVDAPGNYWVAGDQGVVGYGGADVLSADPLTQTFTLDVLCQAVSTYLVVKNGPNRGVYTIVSGAGTDTVVVAEPIATTDGGNAANGTALLTIDSVTNSAAIVGVNAGTSTITVAGDVTGDYTPGNTVTVYRNTGVGVDTTGTFTSVSLTLNGGDTDIVVTEDISALTADGYAGNGTTGPNVGGVATFTVDDAGVSSETGVYTVHGPYNPTFDLDVTAIDPQSSATGVLTLLSYDVTV